MCVRVYKQLVHSRDEFIFVIYLGGCQKMGEIVAYLKDNIFKAGNL